MDENNIWHHKGTARDFFFVEMNEFDFIVQKISSEFLPAWANGLAIEYRSTFKKIPPQGIRTAISELAGFLLGTPLIPVGSTQLDSQNNVTGRIALNNRQKDIVHLCSSVWLSPIRYDHGRNIETIFAKLISTYLQLEQDLDLSNVLWKYWIARSLAIGTNLPILSSALESLAENYLEKNNLKKKYSKQEKKPYLKFVKDELEPLFEKLWQFDFGEKVINQIKNPFHIGIGEKLKIFFKALDFDIHKKTVENEALLSRNLMAHASLDNSDVQVKKAVRLSRAYETLFNRTLLKILGYQEKYIDYYTHGYPEKEINENITLE